MLTTNRGYTVIQVEPEKIIPALQDWQFEVDADIEGAISFRTNTPTLDISGAGPFSDEVNHQDQQLELYGAITGNRDIIWPTADTVVGPTIVYNRAAPVSTDGYAAPPKYVNIQTDVDVSALIPTLTAFWDMDEASGTRNDSIGSTNLTDNNTVTSTTGRIGLAADFTAANSESLSHASNATVQTGDVSFTFAVQFKADTITGDHVLISKDANTAGNREYTLLINFATGKLNFQVFRAGDTAVVAASAETIIPGVWYTAVVWHDAVGDTVNLQLDNGKIIPTATGGALQAAGTANFRIGARDYSGAEGYWDGQIDNVLFAKRVLTAHERLTYFRAPEGAYKTIWPGMARLAWHSGGQILTTPQFDPLTDDIIGRHMALGNGIIDPATGVLLPAMPDQRTGGAAGTQALNIRRSITDLASHDPGGYDRVSGNGPYSIGKHEGLSSWLQINSVNALPSVSEIYSVRGFVQMQSPGSLTHLGNPFATTGEFLYGEAGVLTAGMGLYGEFQHYGAGTVTNGYAIRGLFRTTAAAGAITTGYAGRFDVRNIFAVPMTNVRGVHAEITNESSGTMTTSRVFDGRIRNQSTGTMTTTSVVRIQPPENSGGGTITGNIGLDINDQTGVTGVSDSENMRSRGANALNVFEGVIRMLNGPAPGSSPADMVQLYSTDISAGNASLGIRTETAVVTESVSSDRTLAVKINGTNYRILLAA